MGASLVRRLFSFLVASLSEATSGSRDEAPRCACFEHRAMRRARRPAAGRRGARFGRATACRGSCCASRLAFASGHRGLSCDGGSCHRPARLDGFLVPSIACRGDSGPCAIVAPAYPPAAAPRRPRVAHGRPTALIEDSHRSTRTIDASPPSSALGSVRLPTCRARRRDLPPGSPSGRDAPLRVP